MELAAYKCRHPKIRLRALELSLTISWLLVVSILPMYSVSVSCDKRKNCIPSPWQKHSRAEVVSRNTERRESAADGPGIESTSESNKHSIRWGTWGYVDMQFVQVAVFVSVEASPGSSQHGICTAIWWGDSGSLSTSVLSN